tara:strand:+ start:10433 stop:13252 length:2820 start_codon:yes stop_codon:yes gene_type:complete
MRNIANSVGTYNIVITSNKQTALNLTKYKSYKRFTDKHGSDEDSVFMSTGREKLQESMQTPMSEGVNILEFTHIFNYAGGGKSASKDSGFKIKTHEAGLGFLKKLFFMSTGESMSFLKEKKAYIDSLNKKIDDYGIEATEYDRSAGQGAWVDDNPIDASRLNTAEAQLKDIIARNAHGQKVYIAYGIGDDMKYWAGPFQTLLGETQYSNDGAKETITYFFASDQVKHLYEGKTVLDFSTPVSKELGNRFKIPVQAYDFLPQAAPAPNADYDDPYADIIDWDGYTPSIHDCVVKLISYYLHSIGVKNHIIVLPNLDKILSPFIESVLTQEIRRSRPGSQYPSIATANALFTGGDIDNLPVDPRKPFAGTNVSYSPSPANMGSPFPQTKDYIRALVKVFANMGFTADITSPPSTSDTDPRFVTFEKNPIVLTAAAGGGGGGAATFDYTNQVKIEDPFSDPAATPMVDSILHLGLDLTQWEGKATYKDDDGNEKTVGDGIFTIDAGSYAEPIKRFVNSILSTQSGELFDIDYFFESNLKVCEKFKEKFGSGTFAGYKHTKGTRQNYQTPTPIVSDDAYFIFGDRSLIDQYLYGHIHQVVDFNKKFRSVEYLQEKQLIGTIDDSIGDRYFLDPFWNKISEDVTQLEPWASFSTPDYLATIEDTYFAQIQQLIYKGDYTPLGFFNDYAKKKGDFRKNLPDEFGFLTAKPDDAPTTILDQVASLQIPFFIANEKNSNVISFNIDADNFILQEFMGSIGEIYHEVALRYTKLSQTVAGIPDSDAIDAKLYELIDNWRERGFYGKGFHSFFPSNSQMSLTQLSTDLKDIMLLETEGRAKNLRANYSSPYVAMLALFSGLYKKRYKGVIKTLPMFNLSNLSYIQKPAIALLKSTPRLKTSSELDRSTADFFSGLYTILGWKHTITKSKAESEFVVVKDVRAEINDAED